MGLTVHKEDSGGYPMCYGMEHGWIQWAPCWVKGLVCDVWNWLNCTINGHDRMGVEGFKTHAWPGAPHCTYCSAPMLVDGKYPTSEEVEENDRIVHEEWDKASLDELEDPENPQ